MGYKFTKNSVIANIWAGRVASEECKIEDVPKLFNLVEVVKEILGIE